MTTYHVFPDDLVVELALEDVSGNGVFTSQHEK